MGRPMWQTRLRWVLVLLPVCWGAVRPPELEAQSPADSVRVELRRLAALVDSLRREVDRLRAGGEVEEAGDALAELRAAAAAAAARK